MSDPWLDGTEANAWYSRNREALADPSRGARDPVLRILRQSGIQPRRVYEVGCANGWRLDIIRREFGATCGGCDTSLTAITEGRNMYPEVRYSQSPAHMLAPMTGTLDLVILSFVLHWVDRKHIARAVSEADRILRDGGHIIIADFLPVVSCRVRYHHRQDVELWTFKRDYCSAFMSLGLYQEVASSCFDHESLESRACAAIPSHVRCEVVLLRKSLEGGPVCASQ